MDAQNFSGQKLGQYELKERLGSGGMGAVYRAFQPGLNRTVAVKILSGDLVKRPGYIERFTREAQTAAALEHSHIVPVYDYGTQGDISYIVMRLLSGGSLSDRLDQFTDQGKLMGLSEIASILSQLGGALDYAHARGVVHRDIKPGNIMFDQVGSAFLVDFGIAKLVDGQQLTTTGMTVGTPAYMSPEQWRGEMVTSASDQYALGAVIYNLVAGRLPFEAPTPYALMLKHVSETLPAPSNFRPDTPEAVSGVLSRAMAKNSDDRFPSVGAFAQAFAGAIQGAPMGEIRKPGPKDTIAPIPATPDDPDTLIKPKPPQSAPPKFPIAPFLGGIGALALVLVAGYFLTRPAAPAPQGTATRTPQPIAAAVTTIPPTTVVPPTSASVVPATLAPTTIPPTPVPPTVVPPTLPPTVRPTTVVPPTIPQTVVSSSARATDQPTLIPATIITTAVARPTQTPPATQVMTESPKATEEPISVDVALQPATGHVVFTSRRDAQNVLTAVKVDGSAQRRVMDDNNVAIGVAYSPDGKQIAYISGIGGKPGLYIANADGTGAKLLRDIDPGAYWQRPRWIEDMIMFDEYDSLYFVNVKTGATTRRQIAGLDSPNWGLDSKTVLYGAYSEKDSKIQIFRLDLETNQVTKISDGLSSDEQPNISPDGKTIIFYAKSDTRLGIYAMNVDGKNVRKLAGAREYDYAPTWSPNGKMIAFVGYADDRGHRIYVMDADGSNPRGISTGTQGTIGTLAWSPDSTEIMYRAGDRNSEIYIMNADGSAPRRLTNSPEEDSGPALSPDGKQVVFSIDGDIAIINTDGSGLRVFKDVFGIDPSWSPDGKQIVFSGLTNDSSGRPLTIVNADGSGKKVVVAGNDISDAWASFSPDGKRILFTSNREGGSKLFTVNVDGTGLKTLTPKDGDDMDGAWSPDGTKIVFMDRAANPTGIYSMNADGSNRALVYNSSRTLSQFSWSSDNRILFTGDETGNTELYALNLKDNSLARLTKSPAPDSNGRFGK